MVPPCGYGLEHETFLLESKGGRVSEMRMRGRMGCESAEKYKKEMVRTAETIHEKEMEDLTPPY